MAPKRSPLEDPPAPSDEEIGSEDSEESEEEGEEEEEAKGAADYESDSDDFDNSPKSAPKSQNPPSSSDDDDESDSDELEESPKKPKPSELHRSSNPSSLKPVKTLHDSPKPKKTVTKPTTVTAAPPKPASAATKRPLESDKADKDSKRKKKKVGGDADDDEDDDHQEEGEKKTDDDPKNPFQRLWSEDDEIVILKHMSDCKKQGIDSTSDLKDFLDSIKKSLHINVNVGQLTNKIKRLKKKFQNNFKRGKSGEDPVFSKPHDVRCYELMKEIWGGEEVKSKKGSEPNNGGNDDSALSNGKRSRSTKSRAAPVSPKPKTVALNDISHKELPKLEEKNWSLYPCLNESLQSNKNLPMVGESLFKEGLGLIGDSKVKELEEKWRKLHAAELEVYLKRVELVQEQTMEVLKALNSSDSID